MILEINNFTTNVANKRSYKYNIENRSLDYTSPIHKEEVFIYFNYQYLRIDHFLKFCIYFKFLRSS